MSDETDPIPAANSGRTSSFIRDLLLLGAGALLSFGVTSAIQYLDADRQAEIARTDRALELYAEYEGLSEVSQSAGDFATGRGGREEDLVAMFRHFRKVTTMISNEAVDPISVADHYVGALDYWGDMFAIAANSDRNVNWRMSQNTLGQMEALSDFLAVLRAQGEEVDGLKDSAARSLAAVQAADAFRDEVADATADAAADPENPDEEEAAEAAAAE